MRRLEKDDTMKSGRLLDAPKGRTSIHVFYSISSSMIHHHHHHQHPYRRSERGFFP